MNRDKPILWYKFLIFCSFVILFSTSCNKDSFSPFEDKITVTNKVGVQLFGGANHTYAVDIQSTNDSALILLGHETVTYSYNANTHSDIILIATDPFGDNMQNKLLGMDKETVFLMDTLVLDTIITEKDTTVVNVTINVVVDSNSSGMLDTIRIDTINTTVNTITVQDTNVVTSIYDIRLNLNETIDRAIEMTAIDADNYVGILGSTEMDVIYSVDNSNIIVEQINKPAIYKINSIDLTKEADTLLLTDMVGLTVNSMGDTMTQTLSEATGLSYHILNIEPMAILKQEEEYKVLARSIGAFHSYHIIYSLNTDLEVTKVLYLETDKGIESNSYSDMLWINNQYVVVYTNQDRETILLRIDEEGNQEKVVFPSIVGNVHRITKGWEDNIAILTNLDEISVRVYEVRSSALAGISVTNWAVSIPTNVEDIQRDFIGTADNFSEYYVVSEESIGALRNMFALTLDRNGLIQKKALVGTAFDWNESGAIIPFKTGFAMLGTNDFDQFRNIGLMLLNADLELKE